MRLEAPKAVEQSRRHEEALHEIGRGPKKQRRQKEEKGLAKHTTGHAELMEQTTLETETKTLYNHPEVDALWITRGRYYGSFEDCILSSIFSRMAIR